MKKVIVLALLGCGIENCLYAPNLKKTINEVVLTYLPNESYFKKRILEGHSFFEPILNLFLIKIYLQNHHYGIMNVMRELGQDGLRYEEEIEYIRFALNATRKNREELIQKLDALAYPVFLSVLDICEKGISQDEMLDELQTLLEQHRTYNKKIDFYKRNKHGKTALMNMVFRGRERVVTWLLENGADITVEEFEKTLFFAIEGEIYNTEFIIALLLSYGAYYTQDLEKRLKTYNSGLQKNYHSMYVEQMLALFKEYKQLKPWEFKKKNAFISKLRGYDVTINGQSRLKYLFGGDSFFYNYSIVTNDTLFLAHLLSERTISAALILAEIAGNKGLSRSTFDAIDTKYRLLFFLMSGKKLGMGATKEDVKFLENNAIKRDDLSDTGRTLYAIYNIARGKDNQDFLQAFQAALRHLKSKNSQE